VQAFGLNCGTAVFSLWMAFLLAGAVVHARLHRAGLSETASEADIQSAEGRRLWRLVRWWRSAATPALLIAIGAFWLVC
jgi:hypothetical protein